MTGKYPGLDVGCNCGGDVCHHTLTASRDREPRDAATSSNTDLRRARQKAAATVDQLDDDVKDWLERFRADRMITQSSGPRKVNQMVTALASDRIREDLMSFLDDRRKTTMSRGIRAGMDSLQQTIPQAVDPQDLIGRQTVEQADEKLLRRLHDVDAGVLFDNDDSLAEEVGNRVTRQIRHGVAQGEDIQDIGDRVDMVLTDGEHPDRKKKGVTGQTVRTKGELIAHDSIQDGYNTGATKRYLDNGFRYARYQATIDTRTTNLCERMNGNIIDLVNEPGLVPPNHPYCRAGIGPELDPDEVVTTSEDISDDYLQTINSTNAYRPTVIGEEDFQPTPLSRSVGAT